MRLHYLLTLIILVGLALSGSITAQASEQSFSKDQCTVVINEFMPAKQRVLTDEDGDYEDWIELYNCSDEAIDLTGWYLSDRQDRPLQWQFPSVSIPAQGYLLVWASGKDRVDGQELHTNFRINAAGELLLLSNAAGELIDEIPPIEAHAHEVVGRSPDGVGEVMILAKPTPEANNAAAIAPALIEPPQFSHESGFYAEEFALSLSHPDENVTIYYTLDGSEPDPENLEGSTYRYKNNYQQPPKEEGQIIEISQDFLYNEYKTHRYEQPIQITDRTYEPDRISQISTTFDEEPDYFPRPKPSKHWFNNVISSVNLLIGQINRGSKNLNDFLNRVVRSYKEFRTGKKQIVGNKKFVMQLPELPYWIYSGKHSYKGIAIRAIAVRETKYRSVMSRVKAKTYFIGRESQFNLPIISVIAPEKEFYDYDNGIFVAGKLFDEWLESLNGPVELGCNSHANYKEGKQQREVFSGQLVILDQGEAQHIDVGIKGHGGCSTLNRSKSIRLYIDNPTEVANLFEEPLSGRVRVNLRNSGNMFDTDYLRDGVAHEIISGLAIGVQRYEPKVVFLNGEYLGILNARDRKDSYYLADRFGVDSASIDLLKKNGQTDYGESNQYEELISHLKNIDYQKEQFYTYVEKNFDLESFYDYFISSLYLARKDWPGNNIAYWRVNKGNEPGINENDGRWRWLAYDLDHSFSDQETNMLYFATAKDGEKWPNPPWSTFLLRILLKNKKVKESFIIRFSDLMNSTFMPERMIEFIRAAESGIEKEMPRHIERWKTPRSVKRWRQHIDSLVDFAERRPAIQRQHLQEYFGLGDLYTLNINVVLEDADGHQTPMDKGAIIRLNTLTLGVSDDELQKPVAASARATNMEKYLALPWSGEYFAGMPIELSVEPRAGYKFERWEGESLSRSQRDAPELELIPESDLSLKVVLSPLQ